MYVLTFSSPISTDVCRNFLSLPPREPNRYRVGRTNNMRSSSSSSLLFLMRSLMLISIAKLKIIMQVNLRDHNQALKEIIMQAISSTLAINNKVESIVHTLKKWVGYRVPGG